MLGGILRDHERKREREREREREKNIKLDPILWELVTLREIQCTYKHVGFKVDGKSREDTL
jgi:hypothetical protein